MGEERTLAKVDKRHYLRVYQSPANKKWKWAWFTNKRSIAVSGYFYQTAAAAKVAFDKFREHLGSHVVMGSCIEQPNGEQKYQTVKKIR